MGICSISTDLPSVSQLCIVNCIGTVLGVIICSQVQRLFLSQKKELHMPKMMIGLGVQMELVARRFFFVMTG